MSIKSINRINCKKSGYIYPLHRDLIHGRQLHGRPKPLPAVLPIVLYNGRKRWTAPTNLMDLSEPAPAGLDAYRPQARYLLIDESAYTDTDLASQRDLVAALFRLENSQDVEVVREVVLALAEWQGATIDASLFNNLNCGVSPEWTCKHTLATSGQ